MSRLSWTLTPSNAIMYEHNKKRTADFKMINKFHFKNIHQKLNRNPKLEKAEGVEARKCP